MLPSPLLSSVLARDRMMPGARRAPIGSATHERRPMEATPGLLSQLAVVIAMLVIYILVTRV